MAAREQCPVAVGVGHKFLLTLIYHFTPNYDWIIFPEGFETEAVQGNYFSIEYLFLIVDGL